MNKHGQKKYAPEAHWYLRPLCWVQGHTRPINTKGWTAIYCQVCGRGSEGFLLTRWFWRGRNKLQWGLVWLANRLETDKGLTNWPPFRRVDGKHLNNLGTKHSCDAYSYEHIKSLIDQGDDQLLSRFISEDGWVDITDANAEEMHEYIEKAFEVESNKQERQRTMKSAGLDTPNEEATK